MDETTLYERVMREAEYEARKLHPEIGEYKYQKRWTLARRVRSEYLQKRHIILGYGELIAEVGNADGTYKAIRWKLGDGVHTWDELPDIPGPEYTFFCATEAVKWPRS